MLDNEMYFPVLSSVVEKGKVLGYVVTGSTYTPSRKVSISSASFWGVTANCISAMMTAFFGPILEKPFRNRQ
jgi:hypothetical protein